MMPEELREAEKKYADLVTKYANGIANSDERDSSKIPFETFERACTFLMYCSVKYQEDFLKKMDRQGKRMSILSAAMVILAVVQICLFLAGRF